MVVFVLFFFCGENLFKHIQNAAPVFIEANPPVSLVKKA